MIYGAPKFLYYCLFGKMASFQPSVAPKNLILPPSNSKTSMNNQIKICILLQEISSRIYTLSFDASANQCYLHSVDACCGQLKEREESPTWISGTAFILDSNTLSFYWPKSIFDHSSSKQRLGREVLVLTLKFEIPQQSIKIEKSNTSQIDFKKKSP